MERINVRVVAVLATACLAACAESAPDATADAAPPDSVTLTWLSVTNWLLEAGNTRILLDGYVSRVDRTTVEQNGTSTSPAPLDTAAVRRVRDAVLPDHRLDWVLVGHGHWDHAFDTPAWARLTGARLAGARTVCLQAIALGIDGHRCTAVEGGETLALGPGVTARAVRWHHSGDSLSIDGRRLRAPLELRDTPVVDRLTGGLRPGFLEDYPNGGGSRAWLITADTRDGPVTLFWSNTGNPQAWDAPVPADSALFRELGIDVSHLAWAPSDIPTRAHLENALAEAADNPIDLWIGFGGAEHVRQVVATLRPRTFVPHHWDDFWTPMEDGPGRTFDATPIAAFLDSSGVGLIVPAEYYHRVVLRAGSTSRTGNE